jgi:hypothetical protein
MARTGSVAHNQEYENQNEQDSQPLHCDFLHTIPFLERLIAMTATISSAIAAAALGAKIASKKSTINPNAAHMY